MVSTVGFRIPSEFTLAPGIRRGIRRGTVRLNGATQVFATQPEKPPEMAIARLASCGRQKKLAEPWPKLAGGPSILSGCGDMKIAGNIL